MKKMMKYITAAFVAIVAVSCVEEMETGVPQGAKKMVDVTFGVNIADEDITKTSLGVENDAPAVLWTKGDKVAVWDGAQINEFTLVSGEGTSSAMFTGQVTEGATEYCVIYPYEIVIDHKAATKDLDTYPHIFYIKPSEVQSAPVNGFAEKANMAAVYTTDLMGGVTMHNIGAYIKIQIEGTGINSVTVFDNDNVVISGYMAYFPLVTDTSKPGKVNGSGDKLSSNHVTLVPENGKTELSEGTYYLVYRASKFDKGMTVKFTHVDGRVAYYSSSTPNTSSVINTTLNLGKVNASTLNWKKTETITIDFSKWPFDEEEPTETGITGTFTLSEVGKPVTINVPNGLRNGSSGIKFLTQGDYVEFPIIPGKKLKEVHVLSSTGQDLKATVCDEEGNLVGGEQWSLYPYLPYEFIVPNSELNKKYRYQVTANTSKTPHLKTITLLYAGDDIAEISGVTASATNSFTGFTVTGEVQGKYLDAATWGIQYGTVEGEWTNEITGNGGKINKLVEVPTGTYYVRTWASEDGGLTKKVYSDPVAVTVESFSGTITFDFSSPEIVQQNVSYVGTTGSSAPKTATDITQGSSAREHGTLDYYTYTTSEGVWPLTISVVDNDETATTGYYFSVSVSGSYGLRFGANTYNYCFVSIPVMPGYRVKKIDITCISTTSGRLYVCSGTAGYSKNCLAKLDTSTSGLTNISFDISEGSHTDQTQLWIATTNNRVYSKFIFEYEKVN